MREPQQYVRISGRGRVEVLPVSLGTAESMRERDPKVNVLEV
jgi:hypothetical protein